MIFSNNRNKQSTQRFFVLSLSVLILGFLCLKTAQAESVYERVMRTGEIRCGYNTEPPMLNVDPNTGNVNGVMVDLMNRIGELLSVDIKWAEQVAWSDMPAGLNANRYDLVCNGKWILAAQTRGTRFSPALYYTAVHAYTRIDENRIKSDYQT